MSKDLMLDVDQAGELKRSFRRNDWNGTVWTNSLIKKLSEGDFLKKILGVLIGELEIVPKNPLRIDLGEKPRSFNQFTSYVEKHTGVGVWEFNKSEIFIFNSKKKIEDLLKEDSNYPNANVLFFYLRYIELIPPNYRKVLFIGTVYSHNGDRCVLGLDCTKDKPNYFFHNIQDSISHLQIVCF